MGNRNPSEILAKKWDPQSKREKKFKLGQRLKLATINMVQNAQIAKVMAERDGLRVGRKRQAIGEPQKTTLERKSN